MMSFPNFTARHYFRVYSHDSKQESQSSIKGSVYLNNWNYYYELFYFILWVNIYYSGSILSCITYFYNILNAHSFINPV